MRLASRMWSITFLFHLQTAKYTFKFGKFESVG